MEYLGTFGTIKIATQSFFELPRINYAFLRFSQIMSKSIKNIYKMRLREHHKILTSFACNYLDLVELCTHFAST